MTIPDFKARMAHAFDTAHSYADHARVQRRAAAALAERIAALPVVARRGEGLALLEIGCGTGFLAGELLGRGIGGEWLLTDITPGMLARCAGALRPPAEGPALRYAVMDGERPMVDTSGGFDLICSNFTFQWFGDLPGALARLSEMLAPQGTLAFTTLLAGTFREWQEVHSGIGLEAGGLTYPDPARLAASFPTGGVLQLDVCDEVERHDSARAFMRSIKLIGAGASPAGHRPLPPAALRQVMARFDAGGAAISYRVAHCLWTKDAAA